MHETWGKGFNIRDPRTEGICSRGNNVQRTTDRQPDIVG